VGVVIHADATCAVDDRSCAHESEDRRHSLRNPLTDQGAGLPPHGPHSADRARRPFAGVSGPSSPKAALHCCCPGDGFGTSTVVLQTVTAVGHRVLRRRRVDIRRAGVRRSCVREPVGSSRDCGRRGHLWRVRRPRRCDSFRQTFAIRAPTNKAAGNRTHHSCATPPQWRAASRRR